MKHACFFLIAMLYGLTFGFAQNTETHALTNVTVFQHQGDDLEEMTLLIEEDVIVDMFTTGSKAIPADANTIDLSGHYIIPGIIDTHVHMGMKGLSRSPEASRKEFERWIRSGVTAVRDMGGDARALHRENQRIQNYEQMGPDLYFSATVGSSDQIAKDMRLKMSTQGMGIEAAGYVIEAKQDMNIAKEISKAIESNVTGVKFYAGIPSHLIAEIATEAKKQGLRTWAHFTVFPGRPIEVLHSDVDVVSHVWGAFWQDPDVDPSLKVPFTHTSFPEARTAIFPPDLSVLNTDSPELKQLFDVMVEKEVIWDLTYVVPQPETQQLYKKYALTASQAGVKFCTGTDYFNNIEEPYPAVFKQIEMLVSDEILTPKQALTAATHHGARAIGIENTHGTIEVGKIANLVVLTKNPMEDINHVKEILFTMKDGVLYPRNN